MGKTNIRQMSYTGWQVFSLTLLRILIGWHLLYEGLVKLFSEPAWTAKSYLTGAIGPFANVFKILASDQTLLLIVDYLNISGLILIGISLFTGLLSRVSSLAGILLLLFYYLAYPPFAGIQMTMSLEGNYWIVNKNMVEMAALLVLFLFPSSCITGIDRYIFNRKK